LAGLIKSAECYNVKVKRIKSFLKFFFEHYAAKIELVGPEDPAVLRGQLAVTGVGPEAADSTLFYAMHKPVFVVDTYTKKILSRHGLIKAKVDYARLQGIFMRNLKKDVLMFKEYHALLVKLGKEFCRKQNPKCEIFPLSAFA
jgi:endonuclease-3 related protein